MNYLGSRDDDQVPNRPVYNTDPTRPKKILHIEKQYATRREARHLSSKVLTCSGIDLHRRYPNDCEQTRCIHITDSLTKSAEMAKITKLTDTDLETGNWLP